jgi:DNA-binding Lrp family transcriptional regulator
VDPLILDRLDRQLVHALQIDGRAPFGRMAAVLQTSDRTVARRYGRLRSAGALRVVGVSNARLLGQVDWLVRLRCAPETATAVAGSLARRDDTSWVGLASGGTEVTCVTRTGDGPGHLVLQTLPRSHRTSTVTAQCLLRQVAGTAGWSGRTSALDAEQIRALSVASGPDPAPGGLTDADLQLLAALARDGRAGYPVLASATGWSESTVRRRVEMLRHTGVLQFEVEIHPALYGARCEAVLWLTVAADSLVAVGEALAAHSVIAFAAATSGPTNVVAFAACRDVDELYDYLAGRIGTLAGVERVDTAPIARHVKRAGALVLPAA